MSKYPSRNKNLLGNKNNPRWRGLLLALTLVLVFANVSQSVEAKPLSAWVSAEIHVDPNGKLIMCKGEKGIVFVELKVFTARLFGIIGGASSSFPGQTIGATSSNTQVATISPGFGTTVIYSARPNGFVPSLTQFEIKAVDVGSSLLTFTDDSSAFALSSPVRPRANPKRITVTVKECDFEVTAVSKWQIPEGFQLKVGSQFSTTIRPDKDGKFDVNVSVTNSAELGLTFMRDNAHFTQTVDASATLVQIKGQVNWDDGEIDLLFNYDPVPGEMDIVCLPCLKYLGRGEVNSNDWAEPYSELFIGSIRGFTDQKAHAMEYTNRFGDRVDTTGTIIITVVRVYR